MKKILLPLLFLIFCNSNYAQWHISLKLGHNKSFADISAPDDKNIWAVSNDFIIFNTADGGKTWTKIHPSGFAENISVSQLYALNSTTAFLSVNTGFTGVGPGIIYKTTDGGYNWAQVFSHAGNCTIKMGMFNNNSGLMSCSFSSFNGSVKSGQKLFRTTNGGNSWHVDSNNPGNNYLMDDFVINDKQVGMIDGNYFYYSPDEGTTWTKQKESGYFYLQFEDSNYAINNNSANIDLLVRRPAKQQWKDEGDPTGAGGAVTGLVLDGKECWFGMGLDTKNNYYSSDSAKTFSPFVVDSNQGFVLMTKARTGKTIIGATPFFGTAALWINSRKTNRLFANEINIASNSEENIINISPLEQNVPNPFNNTTTINYTLPKHYTSAKIIITDKNGSILKQINLSGTGKSNVLINASIFSPGTYQYSLVVDGRMISSKQMILTN